MYPQGKLLTYAEQGLAWTADTSFVTSITLNNYLRFKLSNPSGSGKNAYIYCLGSYTTITGSTKISIYKSVSTTVTANSITPANQNLGSANSSVLTLAWDTSASDLSGTLYRTIPIINSAWQEYSKEIIVVPPSSTMGMSIQSLISGNAIFHLSWVEQN